MIEQLIEFETAKLAKKGFDMFQRFNNSTSLYDKMGNHVYYMNYGMMYSGLSDGYISAPTQSFLQKWLREKHSLFIDIYTDCTVNEILGFKYNLNGWRIIASQFEEEDISGYEETYEDALEQALFKALKLIERQKNQ